MPQMTLFGLLTVGFYHEDSVIYRDSVTLPLFACLFKRIKLKRCVQDSSPYKNVTTALLILQMNSKRKQLLNYSFYNCGTLTVLSLVSFIPAYCVFISTLIIVMYSVV